MLCPTVRFVFFDIHRIIVTRHLGSAANLQIPTANIKYSGAILRKSADQTLTTGVITAATFDTETADTDNYHTSGSPTRITIPTNGVYLVQYGVAFAVNATGQRYAWIGKNGNTSDRFNGLVLEGASTGDKTGISGSSVDGFVAGDYLELFVFQNSGGNLALAGGSSPGASQFTVVRLGS